MTGRGGVRLLVPLVIALALAAARVEGSCSGSDTLLCLAGARFDVQASWQDATGRSGSGQALPLTSDTGAFWFFTGGNLELLVKLLDGRSINGHWWVFAGALSNVAYTITVTDTATGAVRSYENPLGELASFADTSAFAEGPGAAGGPRQGPSLSAEAVWGELLGALPPRPAAPGQSVPTRVADLAVTLAQTTCDPCEAGQRVGLTATVTNLGPDPDPDVFFESWVPVFGTTPVEDSGSASQGELGGPYYYQPYLVYWWDLQVGALGPGQSATLSYAVDLEMESPADSSFVVNSPPSVAGPMLHQPAGFGQTVDEWNVTADLEWVDDGSDHPTRGCDYPLRRFTPGHIALIDRGDCSFCWKAASAQEVHAAAVVIANDRVQDITTVVMDDDCDVQIPVLMIDQADGDRLRQLMLVEGQTVNATFGHLHPPGPWRLDAAASTYNSPNDPDCPQPDTTCPGTNNYATVSWTVNPPDCPAPAAPADLRASATAVPSGTPYALFWTAPPDSVTFELEEATDPSFANATTIPLTGTTTILSHTSEAPVTYSYRVRSVAACTSVSAWSEAVSVTVGGTSSCAAGATALCLADWRFRVEVSWQDPAGNSGVGQTLPLTADTGAFWFFTDGNLELVVKVLDGRAINDHWWVFAGALSNVAYTITVTDTATGAVRTYSNPQGELASFADTSAFVEP